MDLQAIRYASMVSTMTFRKVVEAHQRYLEAQGIQDDAETRILEFLDWPEADPEAFAQDVSIVLASAEFSKEVTSSVIWLSNHQIDIRCVRLKPYRLEERILLEVQQILPLPEASDYQVQAREKSAERIQSRSSGLDFTRFDLRIADRTFENLPKRHVVYYIARAALEAGIDVDQITKHFRRAARRFIWLEGDWAHEEFIEQIEKQFEERGFRFDPRRYFLDDEYLIHHGGRTYAFSNQWAAPALEAAREIAKEFPELRIEFRESGRNS
jgi:hypothetical protein